MSKILERASSFYVACRKLKPFIGQRQLSCIADLLRGEEGEWYREKLIELANLIDSMPETYGQDGLGDQAIAYLHYFTAGCDWYITEKDAGDGDGDNRQWQAYGMANIGYGGERGYISLPEILACHAEIDLHWTPKPLDECCR